MNRRLSILSLIIFLILVSTLSYARPINDAIIAIVNNEAITLKDLKDYLGGIYRQLKVEHKSQQEIEQIIAAYEEKGVNQLIDDKLILDAAKKKGIEIRPDAIEKRLKEIRSRYPSEEAFLAEINAQGITVTDIKNKITDQFKSKYEVDLEVKDKVFINPDDVTQYYNQHPQEFQSKTRYNLDSIYISFAKGRDVAMRRINEAKQKLIGGEDFEKISKDYSEAASVGSLEQGQMVPAIEKEVFSLKEGEVSQPVIVDSGVYVFKVKTIVGGVKQTLDDVKDVIYEKLLNQQFQEKFDVWIKKLREKAYVEIRN